MIRSRSYPLLALALALTTGVAWADEDGSTAKGQYTLNASIKNLPEGGSVFELEGTAKNFPDGTLLHVSLNVKAAASPKPVEAAFFMVRVDNERFKARKVYKKQIFAPLQYWAQADLILSSQRKAIRDWIRRELGLPKEARLVLARKPMEIGTKAEQAAFKQKSLLDFKNFLLGFQKECKALLEFSQKPKSDYPDYKKTSGELKKALVANQTTFYTYLSKYVAWHEERLLKAIKGGTAEMGWALRKHKKRHSKARRALARVDQIFKTLLAGIESRLPKQDRDETDKPSDESKGSGSK